MKLRLPQPSDYEPWLRVRQESRDHLKPFEPRWSGQDLTRRAFAERAKRAGRNAAEGTEFTFVILDLSDGGESLSGGITLSNIRYRAACHASLGYWMGVNQSGRGIMSRAVRMVVAFAFLKLELRRLHAAFLPENLASRRVLEKNGFVEEGFAEQYLQIDGRWRDHVLFGLTHERFHALRKQAAESL